MKLFAFFVLLATSATALSSDVVELKTGVSIMKCRPEFQNSSSCIISMEPATLVKVPLKLEDDIGSHKFKRGEVELIISRYGYDYKNTIEIVEYNFGQSKSYAVRAFSASRKEGDSSWSDQKFLGRVTVNDIDSLNDISLPADVIQSGADSIYPHTLLGSSKSDLRLLQTLQKSDIRAVFR